MDATGKKNKIKIIQQVLDPNGIGGVSSEYKALLASQLSNEYEFVPVILKNPHHGISFRDIRFYYKAFKKEKADIIQIRGAGIDGLNAEIAAKMYGKSKILLCVHGMYSDMVYYNRLKHLLAKKVIEPLSFKFADGISFVYKNANKKSVVSKYERKIVQHIYNRIPNYDGYDIKGNRAKTRYSLGIPQNVTVGVYCGRITREKGMDYLFDAFIQMYDNWPNNLVFLVVGDGDYLDYLKHQAESINTISNKRIVFTGSVTDVRAVLSASDFFVLPSLHENHSIALLEAMAMKLPTICTGVGGNIEIIKDGLFGIVVSPFSSTELREAIVKMLDDDFRLTIKRNIDNYSFCDFSDSNVNQQAIRAYSSLLEKENGKKKN